MKVHYSTTIKKAAHDEGKPRVFLGKPVCGPPARIGNDPHALYRCSNYWPDVDCKLCFRHKRVTP